MSKFVIRRNNDVIEIIDEDNIIFGYLDDSHDQIIIDTVYANGTRLALGKEARDYSAELANAGLDVSTIRKIDSARNPDIAIAQTYD